MYGRRAARSDQGLVKRVFMDHAVPQTWSEVPLASWEDS